MPSTDDILRPAPVSGESRDSRDQLWSPRPEPVDWLWNALTVSGPSERVVAFAGAAAGPGVLPWVLDLAAPADGRRAIASAAPASAPGACATPSPQTMLRPWRATTDRCCTFDLHRLFPVPAAVLTLGPE